MTTAVALADFRPGFIPPKGWDVADAIEDGWDKEQLQSFLKASVVEELPAWTDCIDVRDGEDWIKRALERSQPPALVDEPEDPPVKFFDYEPEPVADERDDLKRMIEDWCFVAGTGVFRHLYNGAEMAMQAFNLTHQRYTPEVDYTVAGTVLKKPKEVKAAEYLMHYCQGRWVQDTMYLPQLADQHVVEMEGVSYLNSYLPKYVPKAADKWEGHWAPEVWQAHLKNILPDDWQLLLVWLAYNVQHPGRKVLWAPIVKGTQGDGKTTLSVLMGSVMGRRNVKVVSTESLHSDFTGYAEGSCVAFLEEIRVKGHNRHDAMNKLKPLVTNAVVDVVRKGSDGRNVPNVTNYMAFTNFDDALVIDEDDRRWGVFFTRFQSRAEMIAAGIGKAYWDPLYAAAEKHADVLRAWLLSVDTSGFDPKAAPPTTAGKREMIRNSLSADALAVLEMISLERLGVGRHVLATDALNNALKATGNKPLETARVQTVMREIGWERVRIAVKWSGTSRTVYVAPGFELPDDDAALRAMIRDRLEATEAKADTAPVW